MLALFKALIQVSHMSGEKQAPRKERYSFWLTVESHEKLAKRAKALGLTHSGIMELLAANIDRLKLVDIEGLAPEFTE